jgi:hypothetical protein
MNVAGLPAGMNSSAQERQRVRCSAHAAKLEIFESDLVQWIDMEEFTEDDMQEAKQLLEEQGDIQYKFTMDFDKSRAIYLDCCRARLVT